MSETEAPRGPAFGAYRLNAVREAIRRLGDALPRYWMSALARRVSLAGVVDPIDIALFQGQRVRLYPRDNRCERRAVSGVGSWDPVERDTLRAAVAAAGARGFSFVDAGANVGLYTLWVHDVAQAAGVPFAGVAIEPDPINRARLRFNLEASGAETVTVAPVALSDAPGIVGLRSAGLANRGTAQVVDLGDAGVVEVPARPLLDVVREAGNTHIDAMKVDIEGQEMRVLPAFFDAAPRSLWPDLLIVETGKSGGEPLLDLLTGRGYAVERSMTMNTILRAPAAA